MASAKYEGEDGGDGEESASFALSHVLHLVGPFYPDLSGHWFIVRAPPSVRDISQTIGENPNWNDRDR